MTTVSWSHCKVLSYQLPFITKIGVTLWSNSTVNRPLVWTFKLICTNPLYRITFYFTFHYTKYSLNPPPPIHIDERTKSLPIHSVTSEKHLKFLCVITVVFSSIQKSPRGERVSGISPEGPKVK